MKVYVKIDCHSGSAAVDRRLKKLLKSRKVLAGALVPDKGGFMIMDLDDPNQLLNVVGPQFYGLCNIEARVLSKVLA